MTGELAELGRSHGFPAAGSRLTSVHPADASVQSADETVDARDDVEGRFWRLPEVDVLRCMFVAPWATKTGALRDLTGDEGAVADDGAVTIDELLNGGAGESGRTVGVEVLPQGVLLSSPSPSIARQLPAELSPLATRVCVPDRSFAGGGGTGPESAEDGTEDSRYCVTASW